MKVFRPFRLLIAALGTLADRMQGLTIAVIELDRTQREHGPAIERLELLEQSRHQFEALCEGLLLKAEGKWRATSNAEARERQMRKSYEHLIDPLAEVGDEPEASTRNPDGADDAAPGQAEGVQPLHLDVAPSNKTLAQRAKFGVRG